MGKINWKKLKLKAGATILGVAVLAGAGVAVAELFMIILKIFV